jgi:hypothetical protein
VIPIAAIALATLPAGGHVPDAFIGTYALGQASKNGCDPALAFIIRPNELRLRGTDFAIVMEESIDQNNVHLWIHDAAQRNDEVSEVHLARDSQDGGSVVLVYETEIARSALTHGKPAADAGVAGYFVRCPAKSD